MNQFVLLLISLIFLCSFVCAQEQGGDSFIYDDKGKRDPFLPLVDEGGRYLLDSELPYSFGELKVTGILWDSEGKSSALINNKVVAIGESISGFMVKDISKDSVTVSKGGKEYIIRLSTEKKER